jgi:hypothetical protein
MFGVRADAGFRSGASLSRTAGGGTAHRVRESGFERQIRETQGLGGTWVMA